MLTFKQFNEQGYPSQDYDSRRDPDKEVKDYDPRSEGEDDFKDVHTKNKTKKKHPVAPEWQFDGGTKKDTSKGNVRSPATGERNIVKQGTSELKVRHGVGKSSYRAADKTDGDKNMPTVDYNSYDPTLQEAIIDDLREIVKKGKEDEITFKNGDTMEVDEKSARTIVDAYEDLSSSRQKKFEGLLEKGQSSFMKALDFANSV